MKITLTARQLDIVVCALGLASADNYNLRWVNRILNGTRSRVPATTEEIEATWSIFNRAKAVEVEAVK